MVDILTDTVLMWLFSIHNVKSIRTVTVMWWCNNDVMMMLVWSSSHHTWICSPSLREGVPDWIVPEWTGWSVGGASEESTAADAVFIKGALCILPVPADLIDIWMTLWPRDFILIPLVLQDTRASRPAAAWECRKLALALALAWQCSKGRAAS